MSRQHPNAAWLLPLLFSPLAWASVPAHAAVFVEAPAYFSSDAAYEAWYELRAGLKRNFDDICGDTFCEGDYSNIEPLRFQCSVNRVTGRIGMCVWTFAASNEEIDPVTGRIRVQAMDWSCRAPLSPRTTIEDLLLALQGAEPLYVPLPGTGRSIYDGLTDCL